MTEREANGLTEAESRQVRGGLWFDRRSFLSITGWVGVFAFMGTTSSAWLRFFFPRVLYEAPATFKAGYPDEYPVGTVSTRWLSSQKVWIVRTEEGLYALRAVCTHLGCTPRWLEADDKFKCPCHGSGFRLTGVNFEGPAPRPLERARVVLADDGQILVDKSQHFQYELGQWGDPEAFLKA